MFSQNQKWTVLKSIYQFKSPFLKVRLDKCKTFCNNLIDYYVIERGEVVGIVALTRDEKIILECQYRHPVKEQVIEIPAGFVDKGESKNQAVKRELLEETGYKIKKLKYLFSFYPSTGVLEQTFHLFFGLNAQKMQKSNLDKGEDLEVMLIDFKEAIKMVKLGKIKNSISALGILLADDYMQKNNYKFS